MDKLQRPVKDCIANMDNVCWATHGVDLIYAKLVLFCIRKEGHKGKHLCKIRLTPKRITTYEWSTEQKRGEM